MKIKTVIILCVSIVFTVCALFGMAFYIDRAPPKSEKAERYGFLTLLPPFVAILLAFVTKETVSSLFVGVLVGEFMISSKSLNIAGGFINSYLALCTQIIKTMADQWNSGIILQSLLIGGVIQLVAKMGGAKALAEALAKFANTPRKGQLITEFLGLCVFFDDYANSLIVGPMMRPVLDKLRVSREKLAFVVDATAAPVAGIAIISTWIGLEVSLIADAFKVIGKEVNGFGIFLQTIPFRFYNILILIFVAMTAITLREFGPMKEAEKRARKNIKKEEAKSLENNQRFEDVQPVEGIKLTVWNAIIPIGTLILGALVAFYYNGYTAIMGGEDKDLINFMTRSPLSPKGIFEALANSDSSVALFQAALVASIVSVIMAYCQKIKFDDAISEWVNGMKTIVITGVILLLAWSLGDIIKELGTADYLVGILKNSIPKFILPTLIFIISAIISFATGTSYGTMGILMPLTIPLAWAIHADMNYVIICTSGVLSGSIFGDHCSPISDTTILSSMGSSCDHISHVQTQIYYSLYIAIITIFVCYIPAGFGIYWYITIPVAIIVMYGGLRIFGEKIENGVEGEEEITEEDAPKEIKIELEQSGGEQQVKEKEEKEEEEEPESEGLLDKEKKSTNSLKI
ncbi:Na+/H+ antiporter family [Neocallimastix californiae]|uniref:Na+/H+ antiporter family n=1 Tax=Neocallimastix californiae TaxID=1754190 RepID=A0A1Y2FKW2_9FUNG|nr:Na+/H+ antiporter family [Neocallimastix californiae]|eukprot:ORY83984.1 Na+/H+ antiporter family [Neocallimastix californiae]